MAPHQSQTSKLVAAVTFNLKQQNFAPPKFFQTSLSNDEMQAADPFPQFAKRQSPSKLKVQNRPDKEILEQLSEYQVMDKVAPTAKYIKGVYTCFEESDETILGIV